MLLPPPGFEQYNSPRSGATKYQLRGDFLVHCHVEMHMMQGLAALLRSHQTVYLTPAEVQQLDAQIGLALDPGGNACPAVSLDRCANAVGGALGGAPGTSRDHLHARGTAALLAKAPLLGLRRSRRPVPDLGSNHRALHGRRETSRRRSPSGREHLVRRARTSERRTGHGARARGLHQRAHSQYLDAATAAERRHGAPRLPASIRPLQVRGRRPPTCTSAASIRRQSPSQTAKR